MNLKVITVLIVILICIVSAARAQQGGKVTQINISHLLNARPVTTFAGGKLTTWTTGIDGGGTGDGYLTQSAALFTGDKADHALPDNPLIPGNSSHPPILLHYNNEDNSSNQTFNLAGEGEFQFEVPYKKYQGLYLSLTSSEGPSQLHVELVYADGSETKDFTLPDYYNDIVTGDASLSYAVHNLAKWGPKNNMTEADHHNIDVLNIHPDPKRVLRSISIKKDAAGYLVFWAATGERV